MRARQGSVVLDRRSNIWNFFWWSDGKRHSKVLGKFPTKIAAWKAAKPLRDAMESQTKSSSATFTVSTLIQNYRIEKMPTRQDTRRAYETWFRNHIVPRWGFCAFAEMQARPIELWLTGLALSPKSRSHIRGLLHTLWDFAMWRGDVSVQRNPIELVTVKGASQPRSLTVAEF